MANSRESYYNILGIEKNANVEEIKKAYYTLALSYHPDKTNNDPKKTARFKKIQEAYECLSDPLKRQDYDRTALEELVNKFAEHMFDETFVDSTALLGTSIEVLSITDPTILTRLHLLITAINNDKAVWNKSTSLLEGNTLQKQQYINAVASSVQLATKGEFNDAEKTIFIDVLKSATESITKPTPENLKKFEEDQAKLDEMLDKNTDTYFLVRVFCKAVAFTAVLYFTAGVIPPSLFALWVVPTAFEKNTSNKLKENDKAIMKTSYKGIFEAQKKKGGHGTGGTSTSTTKKLPPSS